MIKSMMGRGSAPPHGLLALRRFPTRFRQGRLRRKHRELRGEGRKGGREGEIEGEMEGERKGRRKKGKENVPGDVATAFHLWQWWRSGEKDVDRNE